MKSNLKRLLSMALVLVMVLSLVPATVFAAEGDSAADAAQNVATGAQYADLSQAISEAQPGQIVKALADAQDVVYDNQGVILDLNGYDLSVTVSEGVTVSAIDSATDNYEGEYGTLTTDGKVATTVKTGGEVKSYVTIAENGSYSFHRYYAAIAAISLKPTQVALGYRAEFRGDEAVKNAVVNYGYELWVNNGAHKTYTRTDALTKSSLTLRLQNIMAEGNEALNAIGSTATIGGNAFVTLELNGEQVKLSGTEKQTTLRQVVESVNANVSSYGEAQLESVRAMITTYAAWMEGWNTAAIFGGNQGEGTEGDLKVEIVVDVVAQGNVLSQDATMSHGGISATVPAGAILEDGATQLVLTITEKTSSDSDVTQGEGESLIPLDVHIAGISADNTTPIIICLGEVLPKALNIGNYDLFHVEDGKTVPMTHVSIDELDAHNEFSYDPATGSVTVAMASFSEITLRSSAAKWTGNVNHNWYDADATTLYIYNADQLWSFSQIVGGMAEGIAQDSFSGKTVVLYADINLNDNEEVSTETDGKIFYPIGYYNTEGTYEKTNTAISSAFKAFAGTFDGNGHTIANFYQNTWEMKGDHNWYAAEDQHYRDGMGLFGKVYGGTVKNLTVKNFSSDGEYTTTGTIAAYADCGATFENIAIFNCNPRVYNIGNGGIVGCVGWYAHEQGNQKVTFKNITVDNTNKISALWGSYDVACGGLVGQYYPTSGQENKTDNAGIYMENCHVAAQIDVYNDVCGNYMYYAYRYAGMLVGSVRENIQGDGSKLYPDTGRVYPNMDGITAKDCTVHYGNWNHYYYCEFESNGHPSYAQPDEYKFSRVPESELIRDSEGKVTGCTHEHTDVEDNRAIYLPFYDQLVTGYGWGVTSMGVKDMDGVEILDRKVADSVEKFDAKVSNGTTYWTGSEVKVGDLFAEKAGLAVEITKNVQVSVSPVGATSTASAVYDAATTWTEGTLTFSGKGAAEIIITDYYFCTETRLEVYVDGYTVRYNDPNGITTVIYGENGIDKLPPREAYKGKTFYGWSTTEVADKSTAATKIANGYKPADKDDFFLYAVYTYDETVAGSGDYEKVTTAPADWSGEYLIVYESGKVAFNGGLSTLDATSNTISVTINNNTIAASDATDAAIFTIAKDANGKYTIKSKSGKYIGRTANSNELDESTSTAYTNTITLNGTNVNIIGSGGAYLRYNATSGQCRFRYYKSSSYSSQKPIALYKKGVGGSETSTYYVSYIYECSEHPNTVTDYKAATCIAEGYNKVICADCGRVITDEVLPIIAHNYVDGTCSMCGQAEPVEPTESYFTKVTTAPADWSGTYLIVYEDGNVAFNGGLETLDGTSNTIAVTIENNKILANDTTNAAVFTIVKVNEGYTIRSASGFYIGQTKYDNGLVSSQTNPYVNGLALDSSGNALITIVDTTLKYNKALDQNRFRYYKSGQESIALYKLDSDQQIENGVTVTYFENGVENAVTVEKGTAIELPTPTNIPIGYTFVGWTDGEVGYTTTEQEITPEGESFTVNSNLEFHALYSRVDIISGDATPVTDVSNLTVGDQVIICATHSGKTYALSTKQNNNNRSAMEVTAGKLETGIQLLTLQEGAAENTFAFYTGTGYLYAASSGSNHLKTDDKLTENGSWEITASSAIAKGAYTRNVMQFNANNGTPIFSCYAEDKTEDTYADVTFYKTSNVVTATYYTTLAQ